jgi:hypothetical protein
VDLYLKVRLKRRGGMSEREAAGHFGISRASVKKKMMFSVPPGYQRVISPFLTGCIHRIYATIFSFTSAS